MPRGIPKNKKVKKFESETYTTGTEPGIVAVKELEPGVETSKGEVKTAPATQEAPHIKIANWLSRKVGFENLDAEKQQFTLNKARKMVAAGYEIKNGTAVQVIK